MCRQSTDAVLLYCIVAHIKVETLNHHSMFAGPDYTKLDQTAIMP